MITAQQARNITSGDFKKITSEIEEKIKEEALLGGTKITYTFKRNNKHFITRVISLLVEIGYSISKNAYNENVIISWRDINKN